MNFDLTKEDEALLSKKQIALLKSTNNHKKRYALLTLLFGILALVFPVIGLFFAIEGIIFYFKTKAISVVTLKNEHTIANIGLIGSIISIVYNSYLIIYFLMTVFEGTKYFI